MLKFIVFLSTVAALFLITNTNGFLLRHKNKCPITTFKGGKEFSGAKILADKEFITELKKVAAVAKQCNVRVHVIDSFTQLKSPTEYVLASQMPLAIGRGIHFDLQTPKGSTVCNKLCMTTGAWKTVTESNCFVTNVQKKGLKFVEPNLLEDGYAAKIGTSQAETLKVATQKLCAPKTKTASG